MASSNDGSSVMVYVRTAIKETLGGKGLGSGSIVQGTGAPAKCVVDLRLCMLHHPNLIGALL